MKTRGYGAPQNDPHDEWAAVAPAWKRWEPYLQNFTWPVTLRMLSAMKLAQGARVLDVGSGAGDPALMIGAAVGESGLVMGIDPVRSMVETARQRAEVLGLKNVSFRTSTLEDLAEPDGRFDAVSMKFALMFMPDAAGAVTLARRLLRTGGRLAVAVWGPPEVNPLFAIPRAELRKVSGSADKTDPNAPGPLRFSGEGELEQLLIDNGFSDVRVEPVRLYQFARDPADYWALLTEIVPPFREQFAKLTPQQQKQVEEGVMRRVASHTVGGVVRIPAVARVGVGVK